MPLQNGTTAADAITHDEAFLAFVDRRVKVGQDYWQIVAELRERYPAARLSYPIFLARLKALGYKPPARWKWDKTLASSRRKLENGT